MPASPVIHRRILGTRLRAARTAAGVDTTDAEKHLGVGRSMLAKMELGRRGVKLGHLITLTELYRLSKEETDELLFLAAQADAPAWWTIYRVPDHYAHYIGLETAADRLLGYEPTFVPGLLQTEDYARAIEEASPDENTAINIERATGLRHARQARINTGENPLRIDVVVSEPALHWEVGGPKVMARQVDHLVRMSEQDHVAIRVLPFNTGAHPAMRGPYCLLRFDAYPELDTVYLEQHYRSDYLERPEQVRTFVGIHDDLRRRSLDPDATRTWLRNLSSALSTQHEER